MLMSDLPWVMVRCLVCTVLIECALAWCLGLRSLRAQGTAALVNVMTNPLLVAVTFGAAFFGGRTVYWVALAALETAAVLAEGAVYRAVLRPRHPFWLSLGLNAASYGIGEILNHFVFI